MSQESKDFTTRLINAGFEPGDFPVDYQTGQIALIYDAMNYQLSDKAIEIMASLIPPGSAGRAELIFPENIGSTVRTVSLLAENPNLSQEEIELIQTCFTAFESTKRHLHLAETVARVYLDKDMYGVFDEDPVVLSQDLYVLDMSEKLDVGVDMINEFLEADKRSVIRQI